MRVLEMGESNDHNGELWAHQCTSTGALGPNSAFVSRPTNFAKVKRATCYFR